MSKKIINILEKYGIEDENAWRWDKLIKLHQDCKKKLEESTSPEQAQKELTEESNNLLRYIQMSVQFHLKQRADVTNQANNISSPNTRI